jgi:hypothetical protein
VLAYRRLGQGSGQLNIGLLLTGKDCLVLRNVSDKPTPYTIRAVVPASCGLPKKRLAGVESKNKVIIARFKYRAGLLLK